MDVADFVIHNMDLGETVYEKEQVPDVSFPSPLQLTNHAFSEQFSQHDDDEDTSAFQDSTDGEQFAFYTQDQDTTAKTFATTCEEYK